MLQSILRQTGIVPIHVQCAKPWEMRWCIGRISISTIEKNKIIEVSNNGIILCEALGTSCQRPASVGPLTNYAITSALAARWVKPSHWRNNGGYFVNGSWPCKYSWQQSHSSWVIFERR